MSAGEENEGEEVKEGRHEEGWLDATAGRRRYHSEGDGFYLLQSFCSSTVDGEAGGPLSFFKKKSICFV